MDEKGVIVDGVVVIDDSNGNGCYKVWVDSEGPIIWLIRNVLPKWAPICRLRAVGK